MRANYVRPHLLFGTFRASQVLLKRAKLERRSQKTKKETEIKIEALPLNLVDLRGLEPLTSTLPVLRAPSCATGPRTHAERYLFTAPQRYFNK